MRPVVWDVQASDELASVRAYLFERNAQAASEVAERLMAIVGSLGRFPDMGVAGRVKGTRELIVPDLPYVFVYRATAAHIHILDVFHTSMDR